MFPQEWHGEREDGGRKRDTWEDFPDSARSQRADENPNLILSVNDRRGLAQFLSADRQRIQS